MLARAEAVETAAPAITAVLCTYNRYTLLPRAIASLTAQDLGTDNFEIVVIDNSPDHVRSLAEAASFAHIANLRWVIEATPGLSQARNRAAEIAAAPILSFLDDDVLAEPGWLSHILASFARFGPGAAVVGGRVDPTWGAPRPPWLHDDLLGYVSVVNWGGAARIAGQAEWVAGANISFRRGALGEVGGFSTSLGRKHDGPILPSNEEADVLARLRERGYRVVYDPVAVVAHAVGPERLTQPWFRRRAAWQATSDLIMDPQQRTDQATGAWWSVRQFINGLPPRERSLRALYAPIDDPDLFKSQLSAIYCFTVLTLAGFPETGFPETGLPETGT